MPEIAEPSRLTRRTVGGFGWMAVGKGGQMVLQLIVVAILARLVAPSDFGVIAAALVIVAALTIVSEFGLGPALIQRDIITPTHIRAAFWFNIAVSVALWAAATATRSWLAAAMGLPEVATILPYAALAFVISNLSLGEFLLLRRLEFKKVALVELAAYGIGYGVIAVTLSVLGYGVWALVVGHLGLAAAKTVGLWILAPHPVCPVLRWRPLRELLGYGGGQVLAKSGHFVATQIDNVVVARVLGATALGFYSRSYQFMTLPGVLFGQIVDRVLFPAMSSIKQDRERLTSAYLRGVEVVIFGAVPVAAAAVVLADELIAVLLGPRWEPALAAFQVLAVGIPLRPGYRLSDGQAAAAGAVYRRAWRQAVFAVLVGVGAYIGHRWGLRGVAIGVVLALLVNYVLMAQLTVSLLQLRWRSLVVAHGPGFVLAALVTGPILGAAAALRELGAPAFVVLAGSAAAGAAAAGVGCRLRGKFRALVPLDHGIRTLIGALTAGRARRGQVAAAIASPQVPRSSLVPAAPPAPERQ